MRLSNKEKGIINKLAEQPKPVLLREIHKINPARKWGGVFGYISNKLNVNRSKFEGGQLKQIKIPGHSKEFAYFLGVLAGEGNIKPSRYNIELTAIDKEFVDKFAKIGEKLFGIKSLKNDRIFKNRTKISHSAFFNSKNATDFLGNWSKKDCVWLKTLKKNFNWVEKNKKYIIAFLEGFFDSEGFVQVRKGKKTSIRISFAVTPQTSKEFIALLLKRIGIKSAIYSNTVTVYGYSECKKLSRMIHSVVIRREKRLHLIRGAYIKFDQKKAEVYNKAMQLRQQGMNSSEISKELSVSRGMICGWLFSDTRPRGLICLQDR